MGQVVQPVRNRPGAGVLAEVVGIDRVGSPPPDPAGVLEVADQSSTKRNLSLIEAQKLENPLDSADN